MAKNINAGVNLNVKVNNKSVVAAINSLKATFNSTALSFHNISETRFQTQLAELQRISGSLNTVRSNANSATREFVTFGQAIGVAARRFSTFVLAAGAIGGITGSISLATKAAVDFDSEMVKLEQVGKDGSYAIKQISNEITKLSVNLGASSADLAKSAVTLRQAGLSANELSQALSVLAKTTLLASFDDLNSTTEGLIATLNIFGEGAGALEKQFAAINRVSADYAAESKDLITVTRGAGAAFKAAGGNLNELLALFTAVRSTTRESADSISTGFRTIFARLQRPETIAKLRQSIGANLTDSANQFVGPMKAIMELNRALAKVPTTDAKYAQVVEEVGGIRQFEKVIPLIKEATLAQKIYKSALQGEKEGLDNDVAIRQKAIITQLDKLKEKFLDLFRTIANDDSIRFVLKQTTNLVGGLVDALKTLQPLIPLLTIGASVFAARSAISLPNQIRRGFFNGRYAEGGRIPNTPGPLKIGRDSVHVLAEPGEFVVRRTAAQKFGYSNLRQINAMAEGGIVPELPHPPGTNKAGPVQRENFRRAQAKHRTDPMFVRPANQDMSRISGEAERIIQAEANSKGRQAEERERRIQGHIEAANQNERMEMATNLSPSLPNHNLDPIPVSDYTEGPKNTDARRRRAQELLVYRRQRNEARGAYGVSTGSPKTGYIPNDQNMIFPAPSEGQEQLYHSGIPLVNSNESSLTPILNANEQLTHSRPTNRPTIVPENKYTSSETNVNNLRGANRSVSEFPLVQDVGGAYNVENGPPKTGYIPNEQGVIYPGSNETIPLHENNPSRFGADTNFKSGKYTKSSVVEPNSENRNDFVGPRRGQNFTPPNLSVNLSPEDRTVTPNPINYPHDIAQGFPSSARAYNGRGAPVDSSFVESKNKKRAEREKQKKEQEVFVFEEEKRRKIAEKLKYREAKKNADKIFEQRGKEQRESIVPSPEPENPMLVHARNSMKDAQKKFNNSDKFQPELYQSYKEKIATHKSIASSFNSGNSMDGFGNRTPLGPNDRRTMHTDYYQNSKSPLSAGNFANFDVPNQPPKGPINKIKDWFTKTIKGIKEVDKVASGGGGGGGGGPPIDPDKPAGFLGKVKGRFSKLQGKGGAVLAAAGLIAPMVSEHYLGTAEKPGMFGETGARVGAGASGLLSGAAAGGLAGAAFGPLGIAIGGVTGGLVGLWSSLKGFNEEVKTIKLDNFAKAVANISVNAKTGEFTDKAKYQYEINKLLPGLYADQKVNLDPHLHVQAALNNADPQTRKLVAEQNFNILKASIAAKPNKSFEEINTELGPLDYGKGATGQYKDALSNVEIKQLQDLGKELAAAAQLEKNLNDIRAKAASSTQNLAANLENFSNELENAADLFQKRDQYNDVSSQAARGNIVSNGIIPNLGSFSSYHEKIDHFSKPGGDYDKARQAVLKTLEDTLNAPYQEAAKGQPEDQPLFNAAGKAGKQFQEAYSTPILGDPELGYNRGDFSDIIKNQLEAEISGGGLDLKGKSNKGGLGAIADKILQSVDPVKKAGEKGAQTLAKVYEAYNQKLAELSNREIELRKKAVEHIQTSAHYKEQGIQHSYRIRAIQTGIEAPASEAYDIAENNRLVMNAKMERLTGSTRYNSGDIRSPFHINTSTAAKMISTDIRGDQEEIKQTQAEAAKIKANDGSPEELDAAAKKINSLQTSAVALRSALQLLADSTTEVEDAQKKLAVAVNKYEADTNARRQIAEIATFGSRKDQAAFMQKEQITRQALQYSPQQFQQLPDEIRKLVGEHLQDTAGLSRESDNGPTYKRVYDKQRRRFVTKKTEAGTYTGEEARAYLMSSAMTNLTGVHTRVSRYYDGKKKRFVSRTYRSDTKDKNFGPNQALLKNVKDKEGLVNNAVSGKLTAGEELIKLDAKTLREDKALNSQNLNKFVDDMSKSIQQQMDAFKMFSDDSRMLAGALNSFPNELKIVRNGKVEVIINGAAAMAKLQGDLGIEIQNQILEQMKDIKEQMEQAQRDLVK